MAIKNRVSMENDQIQTNIDPKSSSFSLQCEELDLYLIKINEILTFRVYLVGVHFAKEEFRNHPVSSANGKRGVSIYLKYNKVLVFLCITFEIINNLSFSIANSTFPILNKSVEGTRIIIW